MSWVLGVDSGGSGLRIALGSVALGVGPDPVPEVTTIAIRVSDRPVSTGPSGIDPEELLHRVLSAARTLLAESGADVLSAITIGAAGMATLGDGLRSGLPDAFGRSLGVRRLVLAADAVTAYAGALAQRPGVVVAAGTGLIALSTDLTEWHRADGWGHLLGDCGGGAWIGRAGLEAAMRAHDGRSGGSRALLSRMEAVFGSAPDLPGLLYPRADRAAVLASFAPEVAGCAAVDPVAERILVEAAAQIADAAAAVRPTSEECEVAFTGGLFELGDPLLVPLGAELSVRFPRIRRTPAAGSPLDGALFIAAALAAGSLRLPPDPRLMYVRT